jgi:hypothetical protein
MMMTQGLEFHKADMAYSELKRFVDQADADGLRADQVERGMLKMLLDLGKRLVDVSIARCGDGNEGSRIEKDGRTLKRLKKKRKRRYVSVFGEHSFRQYVYAIREGQKIDKRPVDEQLGLPAGEHSYVLQDWLERFCIKESFEEGSSSLEAVLGLRIPVGTAERFNEHLAEQAESFRIMQPAPNPEQEGELLVYANDCKGVPMRRPLAERVRGHGQRRGKGEKANKKRMACVGSAYSVERFVRTPDDILDEVFNQEREQDRPRPQNKRLWAEMTFARQGEPINGKTRVFIQQAIDLQARDPEGRKEIVCLTDGEKSLRREQHEWLPQAVGVLDIWHVIEYLWAAAYCIHSERSDEAQQFVTDRLRLLLEGKVGYVIGHLRRLHRTAKPFKRKPIQAAITYFENNRQYMKYDEYLARGYPIGSGVAEGACRHVVKDRMEQTGMRWVHLGAQSMLHMRAIYLNGDWDEYLEHHIQTEQATLYGKMAA